MGWASRLTYRQVTDLGITRSLAILATYGDAETLTALVDANPALANDADALAKAAEHGHDSIVRVLLHHQPQLAQRVAVAAKTRELTELLFANGMNPNLAGWLGVTPLHRFARQGHVEKAAIFIDHGANLEARDEEFCTTPLGYAAERGKLEMVEYLLGRGARANLPDGPAWAMPAALATYRGHTDIVRLLREHHAAAG